MKGNRNELSVSHEIREMREFREAENISIQV
jgi:hypothetical protein